MEGVRYVRSRPDVLAILVIAPLLAVLTVVALTVAIPSSVEIRACSARTRRAATSKPEVSKIWLPMCECRPRRSRLAWASTARASGSRT